MTACRWTRFVQSLELETGFRMINKLVAFICAAALLAACGGAGSSGPANVTIPAPPGCLALQGETTVNVGTSAGNTYAVYFDPSQNGEYVALNNVSGNFYVYKAVLGQFVNTTGVIADAGTTCLASITVWPGGGTPSAAMIVDHRYIVQFGDGNYVRFVVNSYANGIAQVSYVSGV
jgi:hypothetical protein